MSWWNARASSAPDGERERDLRARMVAEQLVRRGIRDERVLSAMREIPRHRFVPAADPEEAYADRPVAIGFGQTISQPYMVAVMSELLRVGPEARVLEIGTGCGYQTAVLARLVAEVHTFEILPELLAAARARLDELGVERVVFHQGDGSAGRPEAAPFDAILVAAAPQSVPPALAEQLCEGGRLVIPVGDRRQQELRVLTRVGGALQKEALFPVKFVPLVGEG